VVSGLQAQSRFNRHLIPFYLFSDLHRIGHHVMFDAESQVGRLQYTHADDAKIPARQTEN